MQEEFGSLSEIVTRNFNYIFANKRRVLALGIYALYIYLFGKRFVLIIKYFKKLFIKYFLSMLSKSKMQAPINLDIGPITSRQRIRMMLGRFLKALQFLYSLFIAVQLVTLAVYETKRIKDMLKILANNSKKIRIKSDKQ